MKIPNIINKIANNKLILFIPALLAPLLSIVTFSGKPLVPIAFLKKVLAAFLSRFFER